MPARGSPTEVWHGTDINYAEVEVQENWDTWQAKRKAERLGGDWRKYRRYPDFLKKSANIGSGDEVIACQCGQCGAGLRRRRRNVESSMKKHGGLWCRECQTKIAGMGVKEAWTRIQRKAG